MILDNGVCAKKLFSCGSGNRSARIISHIQIRNPPERFKRLQAQTSDGKKSDMSASYLTRDPLPPSVNDVLTQDPLPTLTMVSPSIFTTLLNASSGVILDCFVQNPPSGPQLMPLTYSACKQAIQKIPMSDKAYAPIVFSRNPTAGFRVPHSWSHGGCVVIVDVTTADAEETTTFSEVFERAFELSIECVIRPPHFGGKCLLGMKDKLQIAIIESGVRKSSQSTKRL